MTPRRPVRRSTGASVNFPTEKSAIVVIIECLKWTYWNEAKMEPPTKFDKVDLRSLTKRGYSVCHTGLVQHLYFYKEQPQGSGSNRLGKMRLIQRIHFYLVWDAYSALCWQRAPTMSLRLRFFIRESYCAR